MAPGGKRVTFEDELRTLSDVAANPRSDDARSRLTVGLRSKRSLVVARAARLIKEHALEGFEAELKDAFARFLRHDDPAKSDPVCQAKLALIEALDYGESSDAEPFLRAVRHVQFEGVDTAAGLRARGVIALARIGHADFDMIVAELLTDPLPPVRQAALDALAHRGDRGGAGLAMLKLGIGDEDPLVTLAAMSALLVLTPAWALDKLRAALDAKDEQQRELAAVALGQARSDETLTLLLDSLERCSRSDERAPLLRGIGLHRSDRALDAMLEVVAEAAEVDARAAIEALGARRFEPGIAARVRSAAGRNERCDLTATVDETFETSSPGRG
jgi:HEAT repeat protein